MSTLDLASKEHDETKQGEALILENKVNQQNQRKLYIESYGSAMFFIVLTAIPALSSPSEKD